MKLASSPPCLAVIARDGAVYDAFQRFFDGCGVRLFHVLNVTELFQRLPDTPIIGIVTDLPIIVRATPNEKLLLEGIETVFPNVRVNWSPQGGFRVLFSDTTKSGEENLRDFVTSCRSFAPRGLRKNDRKERNLNILMWEDGNGIESACRAFTIDLSHGGLFACTCDPFPAGSTLWLQLLEVTPAPFKVVVCWERGWGKAMAIPGFGARFLDLTEQQNERIQEILL